MKNPTQQQTSSDGGLFLFPSIVWKFKYEFDTKTLQPKIDELFSLVKENSKLEYGEALSTVSTPIEMQPHAWPELSHFQNWLGSTLEHIKDQYHFTGRQSTVTNSWFNKHNHGGHTIEHVHSNVTFVVTSYIALPPNSGYIEFIDPLEYHKTSWSIHPEESMHRAVPCETNDVLIFPGWLKHRVQPNHTDMDRIVMTFNIK
jgi:uncharacterized protein (TIGR02466 family)